MDAKEQKAQTGPQPADLAAQSTWEASESRFQTPEELDAQFTPPDDDGGGYRPHGIGLVTVVRTAAQAGSSGPINKCVKGLGQVAA